MIDDNRIAESGQVCNHGNDSGKHGSDFFPAVHPDVYTGIINCGFQPDITLFTILMNNFTFDRSGKFTFIITETFRIQSVLY